MTMGPTRHPVWMTIGLFGTLLLVIGAAPTYAAPPPLANVDESVAPSGCREQPSPGDDDGVNALLDEIHAIYGDLDAFLDVFYQPDRSVPFRPLFVEAVPDEARLRPTPVPVEFDVVPVEPVPIMGPGPLPDSADIGCSGIRPGTWISTNIGICTLSFIFTDGADFYASTAGHCVNQGGSVSAAGAGTIGTAIFSTGSGGVGNDFALIKINQNKEALVNPEMCDWAGPTSAFTGSTIRGETTVQTGHGGGLIATAPRPKPGVGTGWASWAFSWVGASAPGDSGSGIRLKSGEALGVVTHLDGLIPVQNYGTRWDHGLALAGMSSLTLMTVPYTHL